MLMSKKELLAIGCLLMAGGLFAVTDVAKETFEGATAGQSVTELGAIWGGSGSVAELTYAAGTGGYAIQDEGVAHAKVLKIDESVICTPSATLQAGQPALVDMMVQAAVREEALELPEDESIQIAVGVESSGEGKGMFKVFCLPKGATEPTWCNLVEVDAGTWHRVTFVFDYATGFAQMRIDGQPIMSDKGYLTVTSQENGAWYKLARVKDKVTSVEVVGLTSLDDLRIAGGSDAVEAAPVTGADAEGIAYAWYDKNGLAWDATKTYDGSGLTLKAKFETGLSPFDGEKFVLKTMALAGNKATFSVPAMTPPAGYTVKLVYATDPAFLTNKGEVAVTAGATEVSVENLQQDAAVYYYRLEAVKENK